MNAAPAYDQLTARALEFEWLADAVRPASAYGERSFAELRPFARGRENEARARALEIERMAAAVPERLDSIADALRNAPDALGAIARASMGEILDDADFLEVQRWCDAVERADALLDGLRAGAGNAGVRAVREALESGRSGKFGFYLADEFEPGLAAARGELQRRQAELDALRGRAIERAARELGRDDLTGDEFVVMRTDLPPVLPRGVRVLRDAPAYVLCALDYGDDDVRALERRDAAAAHAAACEERARAHLSASIRERSGELLAAANACGEIDVSIAAARFSQRYDCRAAEIAGDATLTFEGGRFLPLAVRLEGEGRAFVPLDVDLHDVAALTGPNMGGKSVCLRTCGFVALCAALGLPVPARRARVALFDDVAWLGAGADDDDRAGGLLSSFAREVVRVRDVLERPAQHRLVLLDEFARTTTPAEAKALLVALLERLRALGACGLAATHLAGVAEAAGVRHFAVRGLLGATGSAPPGDLQAALTALAAAMDYSIAEVRGEAAAGSDALELAALLGLDQRLVGQARRHLEENWRSCSR
ncbi:MAG TPA: hypothetical protein VJP76_05010 [Candidatus Tumulicola sp.]|nr:hypothetical protein [Candidatus Tumulicola sp.]